MPYLLKPKRYAMLRDINTGRMYKSKWRKEPYKIYCSPNESCLVLDSELSLVKFLRSRITEDAVDATQKRFYDTYNFIASLEGKTFRELIKNNCYALKAHNNSIMRDALWQERHDLNRISSSPWNYKIFKLETVVSNGVTLQKQIPMTWHQFFKQCKAVGIEEQCVYKDLP